MNDPEMNLILNTESNVSVYSKNSAIKAEEAFIQ
jgi:hypothetical protein